MRWRLVEIPDDQSVPSDLTDAELIGVSIMMRENCGEPFDDHNVYWRAWSKLHDLGVAANKRASEE